MKHSCINGNVIMNLAKGMVISALVFFAACDDSSSASSTDEPSSSSVVQSSSSKKVHSSSSTKSSSSSEKQKQSSSSQVESSSSSDVEPANESSSSVSSSSVSRSSSSFIDDSEYDERTHTLKDLRDGHVYRTVRIDSQLWMAENLNYAYLVPTAELDSSSFCYDELQENCAKYGRLYIWSAVMDSAGVFSDKGKGCGNGVLCSPPDTVRGVCPLGWHIPSIENLIELQNAVGGSNTEGKVLKSWSGWCEEGCNGTDAYGFTFLPAGVFWGEYLFMGRNASIWGSYEGEKSQAQYVRFSSVDLVYDGITYKSSGYSVRCLKDNPKVDVVFLSCPVWVGNKITPSEDLKDPRDNKTYKTVKIGSQIWMAENLDYADSVKTASLKGNNWCYDNLPAQCENYGRFYTWEAAMDSVCPPGWHLPSREDWETLIVTVDGTITEYQPINTAGAKLKSTCGWINKYNGTDMYGFTALPAGDISSEGESYDIRYYAKFWSSTGLDDASAYNMDIEFLYDSGYIDDSEMGKGYSVRCLKD